MPDQALLAQVIDRLLTHGTDPDPPAPAAAKKKKKKKRAQEGGVDGVTGQASAQEGQKREAEGASGEAKPKKRKRATEPVPSSDAVVHHKQEPHASTSSLGQVGEKKAHQKKPEVVQDVIPKKLAADPSQQAVTSPPKKKKKRELEQKPATPLSLPAPAQAAPQPAPAPAAPVADEAAQRRKAERRERKKLKKQQKDAATTLAAGHTPSMTAAAATSKPPKPPKPVEPASAALAELAAARGQPLEAKKRKREAEQPAPAPTATTSTTTAPVPATQVDASPEAKKRRKEEKQRAEAEKPRTDEEKRAREEKAARKAARAAKRARKAERLAASAKLAEAEEEEIDQLEASQPPVAVGEDLSRSDSGSGAAAAVAAELLPTPSPAKEKKKKATSERSKRASAGPVEVQEALATLARFVSTSQSSPAPLAGPSRSTSMAGIAKDEMIPRQGTWTLELPSPDVATPEELDRLKEIGPLLARAALWGYAKAAPAPSNSAPTAAEDVPVQAPTLTSASQPHAGSLVSALPSSSPPAQTARPAPAPERVSPPPSPPKAVQRSSVSKSPSRPSPLRTSFALPKSSFDPTEDAEARARRLSGMARGPRKSVLEMLPSSSSSSEDEDDGEVEQQDVEDEEERPSQRKEVPEESPEASEDEDERASPIVDDAVKESAPAAEHVHATEVRPRSSFGALLEDASASQLPDHDRVLNDAVDLAQHDTLMRPDEGPAGDEAGKTVLADGEGDDGRVLASDPRTPGREVVVGGTSGTPSEHDLPDDVEGEDTDEDEGLRQATKLRQILSSQQQHADVDAHADLEDEFDELATPTQQPAVNGGGPDLLEGQNPFLTSSSPAAPTRDKAVEGSPPVPTDDDGKEEASAADTAVPPAGAEDDPLATQLPRPAPSGQSLFLPETQTDEAAPSARQPVVPNAEATASLSSPARARKASPTSTDRQLRSQSRGLVNGHGSSTPRPSLSGGLDFSFGGSFASQAKKRPGPLVARNSGLRRGVSQIRPEDVKSSQSIFPSTAARTGGTVNGGTHADESSEESSSEEEDAADGTRLGREKRAGMATRSTDARRKSAKELWDRETRRTTAPRGVSR